MLPPPVTGKTSGHDSTRSAWERYTCRWLWRERLWEKESFKTKVKNATGKANKRSMIRAWQWRRAGWLWWWIELRRHTKRRPRSLTANATLPTVLWFLGCYILEESKRNSNGVRRTRCVRWAEGVDIQKWPLQITSCYLPRKWRIPLALIFRISTKMWHRFRVHTFMTWIETVVCLHELTYQVFRFPSTVDIKRRSVTQICTEFWRFKASQELSANSDDIELRNRLKSLLTLRAHKEIYCV